MSSKRPVTTAATLMAIAYVACCTSASAQTVRTTTTEGLTLRETLNALTAPSGGTVIGEAISFATALEVAGTPTGTSSSGFVFKLDRSTGLEARTATTFGPAFAERALTAGEGKISIAVNFSAFSYDKLGSLSLDQIQTASLVSKQHSLSGHASFVLSSQTVTFQGTIGATDNLDLAVAVPLVSVKVDAVSWLQDDERVDASGQHPILRLTEGSGLSTGVGDIAVLAKYRVLKFGEGQPDPGGVAVLATMRLPTGDRENLRGLGVTRTLAAIVLSAGQGRLRPHGDVGFEWWSKAVAVNEPVLGPTPGVSPIPIRNQFQYAAGLEYEAVPKLTLLIDVLGRHIQGGGTLARTSVQVPDTETDTDIVASFLAGSRDGIRKVTLAPGLKWNLKGTALLSLNALVPVWDNGLHDKFTPMVGLEWNF